MSTSRNLTVFIILIVALQLASCFEYTVKISDNGPVVLGANITFTAEISGPPSTFRFFWNDDGIPQHHDMFEQKTPVSNWTVTYSGDYSPGLYEVQVNIQRWSYIYWEKITSGRTYFNITRLLNGNMALSQNNTAISESYVSSALSVTHKINLSKPDSDFLAKNATSVLTYWFVDCTYYGTTDNMQFVNKYNISGQEHDIEALVLASYDPIPPPTTPAPPTTTSTTTTTTTTTQKPTTTSKPTTTKPTTTEKPTTASSTTTKKSEQMVASSKDSFPVTTTEKVSVVKREARVSPRMVAAAVQNGTLPSTFTCLNQTIVPIDSTKTYGYFLKKITILDPIANVSISGNNWLQHGDMLMLQVRCTGSGPYEFCVHYLQGPYNVTGKETCKEPLVTQACEFPVMHYFPNVDVHTILVILSNRVTKVVSPVTVRFYQVVTKAQLSVIVVPVSFSIIAAILIVFGVAYYIQNRSRFTVEVADFNFGRQYADLEYKTFGERLRESFNNALNWGGARAAGPATPGPPWPASDNKYGTMT